MAQTYKKKLIEVAIPLEAINAASAREKSIRHGHPSTLHLWWARRPLAACRAVLFAQLVDDPSGYADTLLDDPKIRTQAEADLAKRLKAWGDRKADSHGNVPDTPEPTLEDCAADIERKRLFQIIEELVKWENSTNEEVLERARAEIRRSCGGVLPPVYDPFSGGGSIPLEAQRLGLPAHGSDLNPVAVMIGKAMIEIPPKFKDMEPIHPGEKAHGWDGYKNAEGLAEDVKYYGEWMRERAFERIGHLYPQVDLPSEHGRKSASVIAWIWARTVPSPDPAFSDVHVPLVTNFLLSSKKDKETWVEPIVDKVGKSISYRIRNSGTKDELEIAKTGTSAGKRQAFRCIMSDAPISYDYIRLAGQNGQIKEALLAVVAEGDRSRVYLSADQAGGLPADIPNQPIGPQTRLSGKTRVNVSNYGIDVFSDMFTKRQLIALETFLSLLPEVRNKVLADSASSHITQEGFRLHENGRGASAYADAITVYLSFAIDRIAMTGNSLVRWNPVGQKAQHIFGRQAIPMLWDFAETNPLGNATGSLKAAYEMAENGLMSLVGDEGIIRQADAQSVELPIGSVLNTDPPYYDNIAYADLSDFFYCWMRPALKDIFPELFGVLATPKSEELVATTYLHPSREAAEEFFLKGMSVALSNVQKQLDLNIPAAIYYAFKQSEVSAEGISSTGWATFIQAVIDAGFSIMGTWPLRTEMRTRQIAMGNNALANSVVLVCRKKEENAEIITRAEFLRTLKRELPSAIAELQAANVSPADMPQSAIGPGMGVFSRYRAVLESNDSPMSVKTALLLINRELDEYLGGIQGEFDPDTRFAISWFEQNGMGKGDYGVADNLARARGIAVESVKHAGIVESQAGKVRILKRSELDPDWEPQTDTHLTVWECLQYLVRAHEKDGISYNTALLLRKIDDKAEAVKDLAYCLYDICANKRQDAKEATAYNALIADWSDLTREAAAIVDIRGTGQTRMNF